MLVALLIAFLTGGGAGTLPLVEWLDHGEAYVKMEIADPVKRWDLLAAMHEMQDRHQDLVQAEKKAAKAIHRLAESRQSRSADFQPTLAALRAESETAQDQLVALRFRLKDQVTREQWAAAHRQ
jgi:hypothetical protein